MCRDQSPIGDTVGRPSLYGLYLELEKKTVMRPKLNKTTNLLWSETMLMVLRKVVHQGK